MRRLERRIPKAVLWKSGRFSAAFNEQMTRALAPGVVIALEENEHGP